MIVLSLQIIDVVLKIIEHSVKLQKVLADLFLTIVYRAGFYRFG